MGEDHLELLMQVASWYYEERLCQADIARRIGRSRSMVSRLLQEARDKGVVKIQVLSPLINRSSELEEYLCQSFGLSQAYVLADPPVDYPLLIRRLGELGAHALRQQLHDNIKISLMWGTTIYEMIWAMPNLALANPTVIQMIGTVGRGNPLIDGPELARSLAQKLNGSYCYLPAPIIVEDETVALIGVEAGGEGIKSGRHAARFSDPALGRLGVLHGTQTYVLQDPDGQIALTHSISAGLDYAAVGPEHAWMRDVGRAKYVYATDDEAIKALQKLSELEGIIPALESAHAVAEVAKLAPTLPPERLIVVNLSGRGDKDVQVVSEILAEKENR